MILAHHSFHYPDLKRRAHLAHQLPYPFCNFRCQNFVPIFRHPHKGVLNLKYRVARGHTTRRAAGVQRRHVQLRDAAHGGDADRAAGAPSGADC